MKRSICFRLGALIKYSFSGGLYWDQHSNKFVLTHSFYYYNWIFSRFPAQIFQITFITYLLQPFWNSNDIPEANGKEVGEEGTLFLQISVGLIFWLATTCILSFSSLYIDYREELAELLNQIMALDFHIQKILENKQADLNGIAKSFEILIQFVNSVSLGFPLVICFMSLSSIDPVRSMFEDILEIDFRSNLVYNLLLTIIEVCGAFIFSGNITVWILILIVLIYMLLSWLDALIPIAELHSSHLSGQLQFRTRKLGTLTDIKTIQIYRSLQILVGIFNCCTSKVRFAYHGVALLLAAVISALALVHESKLIFADGSLKIYCLAAVLAIIHIIAVFTFYCECCFLEGLDSRWKLFKRNIAYSYRKECAYKVVVSFRPITIGVMQPFCKVNLSTFPEWCRMVIDRLIDLLLTL